MRYTKNICCIRVGKRHEGKAPSKELCDLDEAKKRIQASTVLQIRRLKILKNVVVTNVAECITVKVVRSFCVGENVHLSISALHVGEDKSRIIALKTSIRGYFTDGLWRGVMHGWQQEKTQKTVFKPKVPDFILSSIKVE